MPEVDLTDPERTVLAFAAAYSQWELDMAADEDAFGNADLKDRRAQILMDYCTRKKRGHVDGCLSYSPTPRYGKVTRENLIGVEQATRVRVHVDTAILQFHAYRFVLLKKKDGWRIDSMKWRFKPDGEWENTLIGS